MNWSPDQIHSFEPYLLRKRNILLGMETLSPWWDYVERIGGTNQSAIAARMTQAGHPFTPASINRWKHSVPKPGNVAAFAIAHDRPVLEAFVAAGFITAEQAGAQVSLAKIPEISTAELAAELARRVASDLPVPTTPRVTASVPEGPLTAGTRHSAHVPSGQDQP